jgi:hypothetical protein
MTCKCCGKSYYAELNQWIDGRDLVELAFDIKAQVEARAS